MMDANGNYPDEIEFDPETATGTGGVPASVLQHWILKCHRKNAQIAELQQWQAKVRPLLRNYVNDSVIFATAYGEWLCTQCGAQHRIKTELTHKTYCETLAARTLLGSGATS